MAMWKTRNKVTSTYTPFRNIECRIKAVVCMQSQVQVEKITKMVVNISNC